MSTEVQIVAVNVSQRKGTVKMPVERVEIDSQGIVGDAHAGPWHRQVSLLGQESIERLAVRAGRAIQPGEFAENITLRGANLAAVNLLDRFQFGPVQLEVTQIGKQCHGSGCAIFQQVGDCLMPREGIFARVLHGGSLQPGDGGQIIPRSLRVLVITLSDRAAAGEYADRSGPRIRELVEPFLDQRGWNPRLETVLIPDDALPLRQRLRTAIAGGTDLIFTTGGTGVGPRDITPETVQGLCDKLIPGIMEHIRVKFGADLPLALLSRSVAGVCGRTQIYTLPGSVRAVEQYLGEILKTLEHLVFMLHGLDVH